MRPKDLRLPAIILAVFAAVAVGPTTGAHADDNKVNKLRAANQVSGPNVLGP